MRRLFADLLAPFHYMDMTMIDRLTAPSSTYRSAPTTSAATSSAACCTGRTLWEQFPDRFGVDVLPMADFDAPVPKMGVGELFALLERRMFSMSADFEVTLPGFWAR